MKQYFFCSIAVILLLTSCASKVPAPEEELPPPVIVPQQEVVEPEVIVPEVIVPEEEPDLFEGKWKLYNFEQNNKTIEIVKDTEPNIIGINFVAHKVEIEAETSQTFQINSEIEEPLLGDNYESTETSPDLLDSYNIEEYVPEEEQIEKDYNEDIKIINKDKKELEATYLKSSGDKEQEYNFYMIDGFSGVNLFFSGSAFINDRNDFSIDSVSTTLRQGPDEHMIFDKLFQQSLFNSDSISVLEDNTMIISSKEFNSKLFFHKIQ